MKVQNTVIVPLKAVCLLNVNFPPSFAMLLVFCELHRCAQDCSGWKSTFFSSWLLLTFSRPLPTSLQRVWPCGWPAPPEYKSPVLPLGHKPLPHLVPPGLSYLHPNGLDREEGRTCKKKKPGCLNDCEETVHSQTTLDCAARQKQTWSQATQSVGLFITAPSLLWPLQQSPGKRDKAIYSQSTLFSPQNTYLKFLVETMEKKKKAPSYGKSTWNDSISLHLIQLQGEHSKLEVPLLSPSELFCSRKHQAWCFINYFMDNSLFFFLNQNMFYSLSFSTWQRKRTELFWLGNS